MIERQGKGNKTSYLLLSYQLLMLLSVYARMCVCVLAIPLSSMMYTWLIFHCPCSLSVFVVSIHRYVYEFVDDYGVRFLKDMFVDKWGI